MYDLHTHSYHSDGVLGYAELARRCAVIGFRGLVISDHCDSANLAKIIEAATVFCRRSGSFYAPMRLLAGCEITHVPPPRIAELIAEARNLGAELVLVHGESMVEPVAEGTNRAAIEGGADVLAHPGLITEAEVKLAAEKGVRLELSARSGHSLSNGHVARLALSCGCPLSFGSDGHAPGDFKSLDAALNIMRGAGLSTREAEKVMEDNAAVFERIRPAL